MSFDPLTDPRVDPRLRDFLAAGTNQPDVDVASREEILANPEYCAAFEALTPIFDALDTEDNASSKGLSITTHELVSAPDQNRIKVQFIRPDSDAILPCVYFIHGGGMHFFSCFTGHYRAWGRLIAQQGVAVAMVDFRNALVPSSAPEVAPFPAGLNDCVSGLRWLVDNTEKLGVDPSRITVAGDSGGGNLAIATSLKLKREGDIGLVNTVYAMCPFIAGEWPLPEHPSATEFAGMVISINSNFGPMVYGIEARDERNPLAWPSFADKDELAGLPPCYISVNELDPLRDEGLEFYRKLMAAGVSAQCRTVNGTGHAVETMFLCPDISLATARSIADFCRG